MAHPFEQHGQPPVVSGGSERPPGGVVGEPPSCLPLQPRPIGLIVLYMPESDRTLITRNFRLGDPPRCRLCPVCTANPCATCTVVAPGCVPPGLAAFYRFTSG